MLSFKHHLAAAFVVGSLLSVMQNAHAELSDHITPRGVAAAAAALTTFYVAGPYQVDEKTETPLRKAANLANKAIKAPFEFAKKHDSAIFAAAIAGVVILKGKDAFNSLAKVVEVAGIKAPVGLASLVNFAGATVATHVSHHHPNHSILEGLRELHSHAEATEGFKSAVEALINKLKS